MHKGPPDIRLGERTLRVEHENQIGPDDRAYLLFHWFLRAPPQPGRYVQILSSDSHEFGGSGFDSPAELETEPTPFHGHPQSLRLRLPPLGALVLAPVT